MSSSRFAQTVLVVIVAMLCALSSAPAHATTWYVTPNGNDGSDCQTASTPCLTINGAIAKAAEGDTVLVSEGTYTATSGDEVVLINKSLTLSGGWDAGFAAMSSTSIIDGGGVRRGVTASGNIVVTVDRFTIQHGFYDFRGGGILVDTGTTLTLNRCIVRNNTTYNKGGGISSSGTVTINDTLISGNRTVGGQIGYYWYTGQGGGIENDRGTVVLNRSTVTGNTSSGYSGSGIVTNADVSEVAALVLNNSTVSGNPGPGHGVYIGGLFGPVGVAINNSTISLNEKMGLNNAGGNVTLQNTIIAGNGASSDCWHYPYNMPGSMTSGGYNLIGKDDGCSITAGPGDQIGNSAAPIDPMLLPLQANGGPTATHPLRSGSPALNAGNPAVPGSGGNACLATDQRGIPRPVGSTCDIGAFEGFVTSVASITRLDPSPTFAASVDFAVTFSDPVTGVDTAPPFGDFALTTTGVAGSAIDAVSGSGDTYTVSVLTGDRDGTIRLDVVDDDSIFNSDDTPLGGIGAGNGNFTDGESYTFWGNPRVTSVVRASPDPTDAPTVEFVVSFTEPVSGVDLIPPFSDFTLTTTGVTTGAISGVTGSGNTYTVTVSLDAHDGNGTIRLDVKDDDSIVDAAGNPLGGEGIGNGNFTSGEPYTVLIIPLCLSPSGRISTATPRYEWSKVPRATRYRYQLFKGSKLVYTKTVSREACGDTTCLDKPATRLRVIPYKWRMQALVDGRWRRYSAYNTFTVSPRAGYWNSEYLDFTVPPDLVSVSEFSLYVNVEGCGYYIITYPDLITITDGRFAFGGPFYASGTFSTPFRVSGKIGLRMYDLPDCGYVSGGPFSWTGDWWAPVLPSPDAAAESGPLPATPMRAYRAGPFRVDSVAP